MFTNLKYTDHTTEHMFFLNRDWQKKKSYLVWQDSRSGRVWEREVTGVLDLEVRLGWVRCHASVGDWERDIDGLSRFVESRTQENEDEDWLFFIWFVRLERGRLDDWECERFWDWEFETWERWKICEHWINELWFCEFVRVERGRVDAEDEYCLLRLRSFVFIVPLNWTGSI